MTRVLATVLLIVAAAVTAIVMWPSGDSRVRIDAVFDSAKGLVPGQVVKVAGSPVGEIEDVQLLRTAKGGYRARLRLAVDEEFTPFHADTRCRILPQGLLSENYVECEPGSPSKPQLARDRTGAPTVAVERTSIPASLQDLLSTFSRPTSERVSLLLSQLGLGTAGRGEDLNAILRRANPALVQGEAVLEMVADQRALLRESITETDRILGGLAADDRAVRRFVTGSADLAEATASRRAELRAAVRRLPATLDALDATLPSVQRIARNGTPLLRDLRRAAPQVERFTRSFGPFEQRARPALGAVGKAAAAGRRAVRPARPVFASLRRLAAVAAPVLRDLDALTTNARDQGVFEFLHRLSYGMSSGTGAYDRNGHLLLIFLDAIPRCIIDALLPGTASAPTCSHAYGAPGHGRIPTTQAPPPAGKERAVTGKSVESLLDYLLK